MKLSDIKDETDLIPYGEAFFEDSAKSKRREEQKWLLNLAFIAGDQLVSVNHQTGNLDRVNTQFDPEWKVRVVNNRILPVYRTLVAKLTKNKPMPSAKAHSREESDIQAARAAVKLLENHWQMLELDDIHPELAGWLIATNNAFYKQFWNPKKGERVVDLREMDAEAGLTPEGLPQMKEGSQVDFQLGDTDLLLRSPFNCYPERGKTNMRDMKKFGDAEIMDVEDIYATWGVEVEPEKDTKFVRVQNTLSQTLDAGFISEKDMKNAAAVKELYILPCKQFQNGLRYGWAREKLLYIEESCAKIPFQHFNLIDVPGSFWGVSLLDDLIPIQRRWNHLLSKIEMHNDYYNDPPIIVDSSIVPVEEWTTEPGLVLESKQPGADLSRATHTVEVPQLDNAIFQEINILSEQFEIIPVLSKVSYGKDTPNAKSGIAINFLQEKDDDIIRPLIEQIESAYARVFKADFELCQENYEEDRGFAIVGEDNKVEWIEFKKADLEANVDVGVEPGSAMPRSKVAQQAMVMDMLSAGFFTDPQTGKPDFAKALKYMEFGSVDDIYQDNALDSNQAKREIEKIKDGAEVWPEEWHNHQAHIYEHDRVRKTADYETEDWTPEAKQVLDAHIKMHLQFIQPQQPQNAPQPGQQNAPQNMPSEEEVMQFLQELQQNDPQAFAELSALPPQEQNEAIIRAFESGV